MSLPEESVAANTLPEVTTIPTGKKLIFTDPDTNEGGIITLENLTKQILQNLTSQTFILDQGNLTLLQALNQLNSNRFGLDPYKNINIKSNTDLNTVIVSGSYFIRESAVSATIENSPYKDQGYCLYVIAFSGSIVKQVAVPTVANEFKIRTLWNGFWNTWVAK